MIDTAPIARICACGAGRQRDYFEDLEIRP